MKIKQRREKERDPKIPKEGRLRDRISKRKKYFKKRQKRKRKSKERAKQRLWKLVRANPRGCVLIQIFREFDPGSGRTLAACLTHASRTDEKVLAPSS